MNKERLKADLDRLHQLKMAIGSRTYGPPNKAKYAMNNLTTKIEFTLSFLQGMDVPPDLSEARHLASNRADEAYASIKKEYALQEPDRRGYEVISAETDTQSGIIRHAIAEFDTLASKWLASQ